MSTNPNVGKAERVIQQYPTMSEWTIANALGAAGLLITPLHERALKACEDLETERAHAEKNFGVRIHRGNGFVECAQDIGRESLAARRPPERWSVREVAAGNWAVGENSPDHFYARMVALTEKQASAIAAVLNAPEAK